MKVGFAKIGQRLQLDLEKTGFQGAASPARLLRRLARRNPGVEWIIVGRNAGWNVNAWPVNVTNAWPVELASKQPYHNAYHDGVRQLDVVNPDVLSYENDVIIPMISNLDGMVVFLGSNSPGSIPHPKRGKTWADCEADPSNLSKPMEAMLNTGRYIVAGLNALGDRTDGQAPVIFIVEDSRNDLKMKDLKWPSGTGCRLPWNS
jgi:hypothetical protein